MFSVIHICVCVRVCLYLCTYVASVCEGINTLWGCQGTALIVSPQAPEPLPGLGNINGARLVASKPQGSMCLSTDIHSVHGFWRLNSCSSACTRGTWLTRPFPKPQTHTYFMMSHTILDITA